VQQDLANKILAIQQKLAASEIAITDKVTGEQVEQQRKLTNDLRQALQPVTTFFDSALSSMLSGQKNWSASIEQAFAQMVSKILVQIAEMIAQWLLFTALTGMGMPGLAGAVGNPFAAGAGGIGGVIGTLFSGGGSSITGYDAPGSISAYAGGGIVTRPQLALIGENGPELVIPLDAFSGGSSLAGGFSLPQMATPEFGESSIFNQMQVMMSGSGSGGGDLHFHAPLVSVTSVGNPDTAVVNAIKRQSYNVAGIIQKTLASNPSRRGNY
jgi:hypothetical protein